MAERTSIEAPPVLAIVVPVFNDWPAFAVLLRELDLLAPALPCRVTVFGIDDGSTVSPRTEVITSIVNIGTVRLVSLHCNLGHQRAITVGISECVRHGGFTHILVMDGDGEDAPSDIHKLLRALVINPEAIVVASRSKRSEGLVFRTCYAVYKVAFRWLTGEVINFGNYCLIPAATAQRLVHMADSWNHLAASIVKSRLPITYVGTERGKRYFGVSNMNLVSLVVHGFSAISVFSDTVLTRLLLVFGLTSFFAIGTGLVAIILRLFTNLAIPGWATNVIGISCLLFFQSLTLLAIVIFTNLSKRSMVPFIPALQTAAFIARTTESRPTKRHEDN